MAPRARAFDRELILRIVWRPSDVRDEQKGRTHGRYRPGLRDKPGSPCERGASTHGTLRSLAASYSGYGNLNVSTATRVRIRLAGLGNAKRDYTKPCENRSELLVRKERKSLDKTRSLRGAILQNIFDLEGLAQV